MHITQCKVVPTGINNKGESLLVKYLSSNNIHRQFHYDDKPASSNAIRKEIFPLILCKAITFDKLHLKKLPKVHVRTSFKLLLMLRFQMSTANNGTMLSKAKGNMPKANMRSSNASWPSFRICVCGNRIAAVD